MNKKDNCNDKVFFAEVINDNLLLKYFDISKGDFSIETDIPKDEAKGEVIIDSVCYKYEYIGVTGIEEFKIGDNLALYHPQGVDPYKCGMSSTTPLLYNKFVTLFNIKGENCEGLCSFFKMHQFLVGIYFCNLFIIVTGRIGSRKFKGQVISTRYNSYRKINPFSKVDELGFYGNHYEFPFSGHVCLPVNKIIAVDNVFEFNLSVCNIKSKYRNFQQTNLNNPDYYKNAIFDIDIQMTLDIKNTVTLHSKQKIAGIYSKRSNHV